MRILLKEKELPGMSSMHVPEHRVLEPLATEASPGFAVERMLRSGLGRTMLAKATAPGRMHDVGTVGPA